MGKGDKRSKKGKLILGTFGVKRKARKQSKSLVNALAGETKKETKAKKSK